MKKSIILSILMGLFIFNVQAQDTAIDKMGAIDQLLEKYIKEYDVPALSIGIVQDGKTTYINKGTYKRNSSETIDENSAFQIASLSKTFTGIIINQLIQENKLELNASIVNYLPAHYSKKLTEKLESITIRDILHHRSGLRRNSKVLNRKDNEPVLYDYSAADFEKDLKRMRIKKKKEFEYSNFGYAFLGYIAELVTNKSYEELLKEYVTDIYGLDNTAIDLALRPDLVQSYRKHKRQVEIVPYVMGKLSPATAIYSSSADLSNLIRHQLSSYKDNEGGALILTKDMHLISKDHSVSYGYGLFDWGNGSHGHGGDMDGYSSDYCFNPEEQFGFAYLTSCGGKWVGQMSREIYQILLEE